MLFDILHVSLFMARQHFLLSPCNRLDSLLPESTLFSGKQGMYGTNSLHPFLSARHARAGFHCSYLLIVINEPAVENAWCHKDVSRIKKLYLLKTAKAQWPQLGDWGPSPPPPPQDFQNNINFIGFIDSVLNMCMHIKLQYLLVHELASIGGPDKGLFAWRRKKKFHRQNNLPLPRNLWIGATAKA